MPHSTELRFLRSTFASCKLQTLLLSPPGLIDPRMDKKLREMVGWTRDYEITFSPVFRAIRPLTLYQMTDQFNCSYLFLLLPDSKGQILWIGPYFRQELTHDDILFAVEQYSIPPQWIPQMEQFFSEIPVVNDNSSIHAMLYNYCSLIWGEGFSSLDLVREVSENFSLLNAQDELPQPRDVVHKMQTIERRYRYENELMNAVSQGLTHKGSVMLGQMNNFIFEERNPDTLRNMKNYCIIMNTLLRKAAEKGGVHPIYIHQSSSQFAKRIEQISNTNDIPTLMQDMFYAYCRLVNRHSIDQYSLPVQRTITYIDSDLTADLSLRTLAEAQKLSPSYLSTLFKKETGTTLTDFVTKRRIRHALELLSDTKLHVQTVARLCGIPDTNYFSKLFKKIVGISPLEYRKISITNKK